MKFYLKRIRLNNGGYDSSGQYWGIDLPLYSYESEGIVPGTGEYISDYIRAENRDHAKDLLRQRYGVDTTFFN